MYICFMRLSVKPFSGLVGDLSRRALFGLIALSLLQAQAPSWAWAKSAGGGESDCGAGIAMDASGNVYVIGMFGSNSLTLDET